MIAREYVVVDAFKTEDGTTVGTQTDPAKWREGIEKALELDGYVECDERNYPAIRKLIVEIGGETHDEWVDVNLENLDRTFKYVPEA